MSEERPKLDCDVHELLNEANVMTLLPIKDVGKARLLVQRLRDCADQAQAAGERYVDAERRLRMSAEALERKLASHN